MRYKISKYSRFWYGIIDVTTGFYLRTGKNDPSLPITEDNKPILFKSKDSANEYIRTKLS